MARGGGEPYHNDYELRSHGFLFSPPPSDLERLGLQALELGNAESGSAETVWFASTIKVVPSDKDANGETRKPPTIHMSQKLPTKPEERLDPCVAIAADANGSRLGNRRAGYITF